MNKTFTLGLTGKMLWKKDGMGRALRTGECKTELRHSHAILVGHGYKQLGQKRGKMKKMECERHTLVNFWTPC